jgi:hypothetical protein
LRRTRDFQAAKIILGRDGWKLSEENDLLSVFFVSTFYKEDYYE